jgi:protein-L-isoaspartate(D-aspartate) O-methyltransferase
MPSPEPSQRPMTDCKQQRLNMVESQVRPSDVTDRRIIRAMLELPREEFAPRAAHAIAYMDAALPVTARAAGRPARHLLAPRVLAKLVQLAGIEPYHVVLDVGCATGYSTALLATLAKSVVGLEVDQVLSSQAARTLRQLGVNNAVVVEGALPAGSPGHGPFDAIVLNGAVPDAPQALLEQLKDGGRLVGVLATGEFGRAQVWRRTGKGFDAMPAFDAGAPPLPGFARKAEFVL